MYTPSCLSTIAINHYYAGLPFKRLEMLQAAQGVPLSDATQYDLMNTLCLCLAHGRRKFFDLMEDVDQDSQFVISQIATVYHNEKNSRALNHNADERLAYHQKQSQPIMDALRIWLNNLFLYKKVEPNSELGKAINYLLKRWY